jgi:hypothetical protein
MVFFELLHETAMMMDILDKPQCWFNLDKMSFYRYPGNTKALEPKAHQPLVEQVVMDVKIQLSWLVSVQTEKNSHL